MGDGQLVPFEDLMDVRTVLLCERPLEDSSFRDDQKRKELAASLAPAADLRDDGPVSGLALRRAQPRRERFHAERVKRTKREPEVSVAFWCRAQERREEVHPSFRTRRGE